MQLLLAGAPNLLRKDGRLIMEIGWGQEARVRRLVPRHNLRLSRIIKDYAGISRVVVCRKATEKDGIF